MAWVSPGTLESPEVRPESHGLLKNDWLRCRIPMLFSSHSIQFKLLLLLLWAIPYAVLFLRTPNGQLFLRNLFASGLSLLLFFSSFVLLGLLITDFHLHESAYYPPEQILTNTVYAIVFIFPGIPLILFFGALTVSLKPQFPNNMILYLLSGLAHLLYFIGIVMTVFDLDRY